MGRVESEEAGKGKNGFFPEVFGGIMALRTLDFRSLASRTDRTYFYCCKSPNL
jgi:hypothetical protein